MSRLPYFALLTFFAAFSIETIGTIVSVIGLSTLFGANPIIMTLAVALDVGKLVVVALLYKYWGELNKVMKSYGLLAAFVTMTITSAGAAGYLSAEFQKAIVGTQEGQLTVQVLKEEQTKLETRKKQIDDSIAAIPDRYTASQKIRLMNQYKAEQKTVTDRLTQISQELPQIQIKQINVEAKAGPILYIAKAFDITVEEAVKWVILMIIFVFDPLAVFLIISGNFLLDHHRREKKPEQLVVGLPDSQLYDPSNVPQDIIFAHPHGKGSTVEFQPEEHHGPVARTFDEEPEDYIRPPVMDDEPIFEVLQPSKAVLEARDDGTKVLAATPDASQAKVYNEDEVREEITKSSLGLVKPDPGTTIADTGEIGYRTGVYRTGIQSK